MDLIDSVELVNILQNLLDHNNCIVQLLVSLTQNYNSIGVFSGPTTYALSIFITESEVTPSYLVYKPGIQSIITRHRTRKALGDIEARLSVFNDRKKTITLRWQGNSLRVRVSYVRLSYCAFFAVGTAGAWRARASLAAARIETATSVGREQPVFSGPFHDL
jgi:hypothetical protein